MADRRSTSPPSPSRRPEIAQRMAHIDRRRSSAVIESDEEVLGQELPVAAPGSPAALRGGARLKERPLQRAQFPPREVDADDGQEDGLHRFRQTRRARRERRSSGAAKAADAPPPADPPAPVVLDRYYSQSELLAMPLRRLSELSLQLDAVEGADERGSPGLEAPRTLSPIEDPVPRSPPPPPTMGGYGMPAAASTPARAGRPPWSARPSKTTWRPSLRTKCHSRGLRTAIAHATGTQLAARHVPMEGWDGVPKWQPPVGILSRGGGKGA